MSKVLFSRKIKDSIIIIIICIVGGLLYPILTGEYNELRPMFTAFLIGLISSGFIILNEIIYSRAYVKQMKFKWLVFYKTVIYTTFFIIVTILVASLARSMEDNVGIIEYFSSSNSKFIWNEDLQFIILYMLVAVTLIIFFYQMSRKMGQGVLLNFITGRYHKTREEERIFMFMDLNNSTAIAENLGDIEYNKLLNDFFFDITQSIISNYGEIYRYVGDEVVVSWKLKKGLTNAHFIRAFFDAKNAIHLKREKYLQHYNLIPSFTAGFNYGKVTIGEIGEVKSQISFFGDVMYETTEIEKTCKKFNADNLVSEALLKMIELPLVFSAKREGEVEIPGFAPIHAYSITEK